MRHESSVFRAMRDIECVFHLAADPLVRESAGRPILSFDINVRGTLNVLEAARKRDVASIVFSSTSAAYGDAKVFPTPEVHPAIPISNYAASKISAESYVASYASTYGTKATVLRYANIYGPRSHHGVMHDFYFKLKRNPDELVILGNGKQSKSYLFVTDCIEATISAHAKQRGTFNVFNVGSDRTMTVDEIAKDISSIMGLTPKYKYTGGKRGWVGDVNRMRLDVRKLKRATGWKPTVSMRVGIGEYVKWLSTL
ncbi:MAG: GDP-mannose 4,6-dehydratase [Candidatus Micrarchaeota archaeon]